MVWIGKAPSIRSNNTKKSTSYRLELDLELELELEVGRFAQCLLEATTT